MIICICHDVNEDSLMEVIRREGVTDVEQLQRHIAVSDMCTGCRYTIEQILDEESKDKEAR